MERGTGCDILRDDTVEPEVSVSTQQCFISCLGNACMNDGCMNQLTRSAHCEHLPYCGRTCELALTVRRCRLLQILPLLLETPVPCVASLPPPRNGRRSYASPDRRGPRRLRETCDIVHVIKGSDHPQIYADMEVSAQDNLYKSWIIPASHRAITSRTTKNT